MPPPDGDNPQDDDEDVESLSGQDERSLGSALQERPSVAAQAGAIAPLIGILLLLILGLTVNVWVGVAVGFAATLVALPITLWLLARRRGRHG